MTLQTPRIIRLVAGALCAILIGACTSADQAAPPAVDAQAVRENFGQSLDGVQAGDAQRQADDIEAELFGN